MSKYIYTQMNEYPWRHLLIKKLLWSLIQSQSFRQGMYVTKANFRVEKQIRWKTMYKRN